MTAGGDSTLLIWAGSSGGADARTVPPSMLSPRHLGSQAATPDAPG
jgi:hypothetical protein